jgi:hypothetical protein
MPYSPPSGWVETRPQADAPDVPLHARFHARPDCPRIGDSADLRPVDKPYSAPRCAVCANELNESAASSSPVWAGHAMSD